MNEANKAKLNRTELAKLGRFGLIIGLILVGIPLVDERRSSIKEERIQRALVSSTLPMQFGELFPDAEHRVTSMKWDFPDGDRWVDVWSSSAALHQRYIMEMIVPVDLSDSEMKPLDTPFFVIVEHSKITFDERGYPSLKLGDSWDPDITQWDQLVASGGDFSTINILLKKNEPVENFERYFRMH